MIERILEKTLPKNMSYFLFGPRQTGKTTLLRKIIRPEQSITIDLLKSEEYFQFKTQPELFRKVVLGRAPEQRQIFIDEVQRVPELLNEAQVVMSEPSPPQFIFTGSSARKLKRSQANLLGGRAATFKLHPFCYSEVKEQFDLDCALKWGMLPPIFASEERELLLKSYVETYINEEIQAEAIVRNIGGFLKFLKIAAFENGGIINFSAVSRECGQKIHNVIEFYQILEDTLIAHRIDPFTSRKRRLVKHAKYYMFDTGVTNALCMRPPAAIQAGSNEYGRLFEQFIVLEIGKINHYFSKGWNIQFYRTLAGAEADLVIETQDNRLIAVEMKSSPTPSLKRLKGLYGFLEIVDSARLVCLHTGTRRWTENNCDFCPWNQFLEECIAF